jgi:hypothetical protein
MYAHAFPATKLGLDESTGNKVACNCRQSDGKNTYHYKYLVWPLEARVVSETILNQRGSTE